MSRTIRIVKETQRKKLNAFNRRWRVEYEYVRQPGGGLKTIYHDKKEAEQYSRRLRRDGKLVKHGRFYKWKRNNERRVFENNELYRVFIGKKDHFDDVFEKDKEWMD